MAGRGLTSSLAALAGAAAVFGWAPYGLWPVAFLSYALLFHWVSRCAGVVEALVIGAAFGLALHAFGSGWMHATLSSKIGLTPAAAMLGMLIWLVYLALFTALPCALFKCLATTASATARTAGRWRRALLFAAVMTLGEWSRSLLFNGFTSLSFGYGVVDVWLGAFAPVGGMYLCSFVCYLIAALLVCVASAPRRAAGSVAGGVMLVALAAGLSRIEWARPVGPTLDYRLVQANLTPDEALEPQKAQRRLRRLVDWIVEAPADIILTPETAFPMFVNELPAEVLARLQRFSQQSGSNVFLGIASVAANADGFNSVLQLAPSQAGGATAFARYDKVRLMPFGEYSPIGFGWFARSISVARKNLSAGNGQQAPLSVTKAGTVQPIGVLICQEDLIGRDAARWAPSASLLLNPSNLAWFEHGLLIEQQLQVAQMRAREVARPILRAASTGVTAQIDGRGRVVARLATAMEGTLAGSLQPMQGSTLYAVVSDSLAVALCCLAMLPAVAWRMRTRLDR